MLQDHSTSLVKGTAGRPCSFPALWLQQGMWPPATQHFGYSHSRRSSLLQRQPGCRRSQNPLAKRNTTNFSLEASFSSSGCPATLSAPDNQQRRTSCAVQGFQEELGSLAQDSCSALAPTTNALAFLQVGTRLTLTALSMGTPALISRGVGKADGSTRIEAEASGLTQGSKRRHGDVQNMLGQ